ncbi:MAG: FlgD immunoglobulin-like domain containing protein, partial [Candidatus Bathyarchaeia archaeon]
IMRPPPNQPTRVDGSVSITVHFENLIVNSVPKILKWDPDVPENSDTTISYSLSSAQKKNCQVVIKIYNMEGNVVYQTTATQLCPGNYSFTWDGMTFSGAIAPTGLYTFDIIVNGKTPDGYVINEDKDQMRSQIVEISDTSLNLSDNPNYPFHYKFCYTLTSSSGKPPSSMEVTVYAPAGDDFKVYKELEGGKTIGVNEVYFDQGIIEVGGEPFYVVASGLDDELNNKAHTRKPLLEKNKEKKEPTAAVFTHPGWEVPSAKSEMTSGAFTGFYLNHKPQYICYSPKWTPLNPKLEPKDMLQPAQSKALALNAMKSVDVFVYGGHGSGNHIEFYDGAIFQTEIPQNNLYLVVIGSCRKPGITDFPIVEKIVSKSKRGKKCGIGVGGPTVVNGWKYLYDVGWREWSRLFWNKAAKKGLTMWNAAKEAMEQLRKRGNPYYLVEVFHYGGDDYLGHVSAY